MMDNLSVKAAEAAVHGATPRTPRPRSGRAGRLAGECDARFDEVVEVCRRNGAREVRVAKDEAERQLIWKGAQVGLRAMGRLSPNYFVQDGVIPRTRLSEALRRIAQLSQESGLRVANVFHAGDGNLHPLVAYDGSKPGEAERAEELAGGDHQDLPRPRRLHHRGARRGNRQEAVHDVPDSREGDLEAFQRLRCAFDPAGLANPGKLMPTPRLCGEVPGPYRQHPLEAAGLAERF